MNRSNQYPALMPREKLLERGARSLTDEELLAIFLRTGTKNRGVLELASDLIRHFGNLSGIQHASREEFCAIPGLGPTKFAQLQAVNELARRSLFDQIRQGKQIKSAAQVADFLRINLGAGARERFGCLYLDTQYRVICYEELFSGSLNQSEVHVREIVKQALHHNSAALIVAHNHPSGNCKPSQSDTAITLKIRQALDLVDIPLLDHVILTTDSHFSFTEHGIL